MVEGMEKRGDQSQGGQIGETVALENQVQTHADENNADIFNAGISQQFFNIVFFQCVDDAKNSGERPENQDHDTPPAIGGEHKNQIAHKTVNSHLDHHAGHQCGDVGRTGGMSVRQPFVEGHHTGFDPEPDEK